MHDGAPAHFSLSARRYLNQKFGLRWIGRGGPIAWPPRSPDLNPLDFYLWGHLKYLVYSTPLDDVRTLHARIVAAYQTVRTTPSFFFIVFETQCEEEQLPVLSHKEDTLNISSNRTEHSNKYRYQGIFHALPFIKT